jgi:hypothetical protein
VRLSATGADGGDEAAHRGAEPMSQPRRRLVVPLAYQRADAATACGVSPTTFDKDIAPYVDCRYLGGMRVWLVTDLEAFMARLPRRASINGTTKAAPATRERPGARPKEANAP